MPGPVTITVLRPANSAEQRYVGVTPRSIATGAMNMARRRRLADGVVAMLETAIAQTSSVSAQPSPGVLPHQEAAAPPDWQFPSISL